MTDVTFELTSSKHIHETISPIIFSVRIKIRLTWTMFIATFSSAKDIASVKKIADLIRFNKCVFYDFPSSCKPEDIQT